MQDLASTRPDLRAPFPWFGGKRRVADIVWQHFGNVPNFVEPFFGSGAVLLGRPHQARTETINDLDCMVANFWRALQMKPDEVAWYADNPVNEADQLAIHLRLSSQVDFREKMKVDPYFYDTKIAGWWVWGQCVWIGAGWCSKQLGGNAGKGVNRRLPHLGNAGTGVNRRLPHLGDAGMGARAEKSAQLTEYMNGLADRLRHVRVCCGNWARITGPSVTFKHGITGVFLDPPYADTAKRKSKLYSEDSDTVAHDVYAWCVANGANPKLRIALCGYVGEHGVLKGWKCVDGKASSGGGYGNRNADNTNADKERIWFSPHCLEVQ